MLTLRNRTHPLFLCQHSSQTGKRSVAIINRFWVPINLQPKQADIHLPWQLLSTVLTPCTVSLFAFICIPTHVSICILKSGFVCPLPISSKDFLYKSMHILMLLCHYIPWHTLSLFLLHQTLLLIMDRSCITLFSVAYSSYYHGNTIS